MGIGRDSGGYGMPAKVAIITFATAGAAACGSDRMPAADTDADLVSHQPAYSSSKTTAHWARGASSSMQAD